LHLQRLQGLPPRAQSQSKALRQPDLSDNRPAA
jgi:hypothetical protein